MTDTNYIPVTKYISQHSRDLPAIGSVEEALLLPYVSLGTHDPEYVSEKPSILYGTSSCQTVSVFVLRLHYTHIKSHPIL